MKHPWKRSLACLVALLLMLQLLPTGALAAGRDPGAVWLRWKRRMPAPSC
ncbi:MAG: hypothetical protein ACLSHU_14815 [Oscillospiraceae bacterium]